MSKFSILLSILSLFFIALIVQKESGNTDKELTILDANKFIVDKDENIYIVLYYGSGVIQKYNKDGKYETRWNIPSFRGVSLYINDAGNIVVWLPVNELMIEYNSNGVELRRYVDKSKKSIKMSDIQKVSNETFYQIEGTYYPKIYKVTSGRKKVHIGQDESFKTYTLLTYKIIVILFMFLIGIIESIRRGKKERFKL